MANVNKVFESCLKFERVVEKMLVRILISEAGITLTQKRLLTCNYVDVSVYLHNENKHGLKKRRNFPIFYDFITVNSAFL